MEPRTNSKKKKKGETKKWILTSTKPNSGVSLYIDGSIFNQIQSYIYIYVVSENSSTRDKSLHRLFTWITISEK